MKQVAASGLDPSEFTVVPHVAIVDEFRMTNEDGSFVATIDAKFLAKLVQRMNEREATTGDLCPGVIGHTPDGEYREIDSPPVTAYLRNWVLDDFFDTGRKAAFADVWVFNDDVPTVKKFPRRSAEIWADRYEVDPLSFLGATTPARDLGLMKLSRSGSFTYSLPGEIEMPEPKMTDPKETGAAKTEDGKLDQILAALTALSDTITKLVGGGPGGAQPGPVDAPGAEGDELSDEDFMKLIGGGGEGGAEPKGEPKGEPDEEESRKAAAPPVKNAAGYPGGDNTHVAGLKAKLSRIEVERALEKARMAGKDVDLADEEFIADAIALPEDLRNRMIERHVKNARPLPTKLSHNLDTALGDATTGDRGKTLNAEEVQAVIKLARSKKVLYDDAKAELFPGRS